VTWDAVSGGAQLQNMVLQQVLGIKTNRIGTESASGVAFSYDASGNVTGDGVSAYTYDAENRIVSVSGPVSESYGYDAGNHRLKKESGGVVTHYIWEGGRVIAEYERGGGNTPATGTRYYHRDRLSTRLITDSAGAVVGTTDHLPFGEEMGGSGEGEKHKFGTYERDRTGLDYAINRHYSAAQGRFMQADPIRMSSVNWLNPQTLNLYAYVGNDPINKVDPTGKCPTCPDNFYVNLANAAYSAKKGDSVDGWTALRVIGDAGLLGNGYRGVVFQGTFNGKTEYIYATSGTDSPVDGWEDGVQLVGGSSQYAETVQVASSLAKDYPGVSFTGHSLGGGLAAANAYKVQGKAVTFNAAALSPLTKLGLGLYGKTANITAYITRGDPLNGYLGTADGNRIYIGNEQNGHRMVSVMPAFDAYWAARQINGDFNGLKIVDDFVEVPDGGNTCVECVRILDYWGNPIGGGGGGGGGDDDGWYREEEYFED